MKNALVKTDFKFPGQKSVRCIQYRRRAVGDGGQ